MFTDSSVFILSAEGKIYRFEVDRASQMDICATFSLSVELMVTGKLFMIMK
ncbi:hypothetical protein [Succinivibrio dextrinosolvens]|uniref:hypothetical protein n=1 Tax=Succinivibrio dextrinosolvens TaxID=83771 RepID=UPI0019215D64|nr:hypothetical protein [Succinivibrio dextrinosolvens]